VIDVALHPAQVRAADVAVVIDVLRATTVATEALAAGYERVLCAESVERARELRGPGRVLAGERHCLMPEGFDQGNSPRDAARRRGRELVLATTNGAPAIIAAAALAPTVLLACLRNLDAVVGYLREQQAERRDLLLVCSGTDGTVALEDVYVAGRLSARLDSSRTDATKVAEAVARWYSPAAAALWESADARVLRSSGMAEDIAYCATESVLRLFPRVISAGAGVAVLAPVRRRRATANRAADPVAGTVSA
jgi:2-phosphosulfolactate phosphatase